MTATIKNSLRTYFAFIMNYTCLCVEIQHGQDTIFLIFLIKKNKSSKHFRTLIICNFKIKVKDYLFF